MVVACGPYTTSDTFNYSPLHDILNYIKEKNPHVAILIGPFVDAKHPKIEESTQSFDEMFDEVYNAVTSVLEEVRTNIVLVPSCRDAHHDFVYPTPPFGLYGPDHERYNPRLHSVADPALLNINGVTVGLTATDILFHLGKEEISFPPRGGDRLKRLSGHLIQQQSFYPLYPPSEEVNIDYERLEQYATLPVSPQLLLLPSDLGHFVKEVKPGCVVVNPGRITKGMGPGMFARLRVNAAGDGADDTKLDVKAEVVRI
jgi:DNA polymerase alpha subunit B